MSSRPTFRPYSVITNASMTSQVISQVTIIDNLSQIGYDISWTGTPNGTFTVQVSNTYKQNPDGSVKVAGNWTTVTLSSATNAVGSPGNGYIDIDAMSANAIRLVYTPASSTGTLNAVISAKVA